MAQIEVSSAYINEGGYIKMYQPVSTIAYASIEGDTICFNNDFFKTILPRPYPKVRKFHHIPLYPNGCDFLTNIPLALLPEGEFTAKLVYLDDLTEVVDSDVTVEALDENFYVEVDPASASMYREVCIVFLEDANVFAFGSPMVMVPYDHEAVVQIEYRTERSRVKNFPYAFDELDRYNRVQCFATMFGVEYPEELTVYNEVSTGRTQKFNSILQRTFVFETYYLDFPTHEGVATIFHHDDIKINGRKYVSTDAYNPNYLPEKDLTKGTITISDSQFSERLLNCPT